VRPRKPLGIYIPPIKPGVFAGCSPEELRIKSLPKKNLLQKIEALEKKEKERI